jgi:hypothetical protein
MRETCTSSLSGGRRQAFNGCLLRPDTDEGGEPQGFRKERPRDPPEGRGKQVYVSMRCHIHEAQNSRKYVQWTIVE